MSSADGIGVFVAILLNSVSGHFVCYILTEQMPSRYQYIVLKM
jgi:hypothetical protein